MKRHALRLFVAFLAFCVGIAVANAIHLMNNLAIVEQVSTIARIRTLDTNSSEANEVYKVILHEKFPLDRDLKLLILDPQITAYTPYENASMRRELGLEGSFTETIQKFIPGADTQTLQNYQGVNSFGGPLRLYAPDLNIEFSDIADISHLDVDTFWSEFYRKYPNSYGIIYFSRVGFNDRFDQAFVYVQQSCQDTCGSGSYVLLGKSNNKWHILQETLLWIS